MRGQQPPPFGRAKLRQGKHPHGFGKTHSAGYKTSKVQSAGSPGINRAENQPGYTGTKAYAHQRGLCSSKTSGKRLNGKERPQKYEGLEGELENRKVG